MMCARVITAAIVLFAGSAAYAAECKTFGGIAMV